MPDELKPTARLCFRSLNESDLPIIESILGDPETMALSLLPLFSRNQSRSRLESIIESSCYPRLGKLGIVSSEGQLIGYCGIEKTLLEGHLVYEFGIMLQKDAWGRGFGSEAAKQVLEFQFQYADSERIFAIVDLRNIASCKVLEHAGMSFVKESQYGERPVAIYLMGKK